MLFNSKNTKNRSETNCETAFHYLDIHTYNTLYYLEDEKAPVFKPFFNSNYDLLTAKL